MNKIKRLGVFNYLRNGEHFQLHWTLHDFLTDKVTDFTPLSTIFATYKNLFEHEDIVFKHNARMVGTMAIKAADRVRGDAFRAMRMTVKGLTLNIDLPNRKLADDLLLIIDNFKRAPYKAYAENTAYISNLVEELQIPANFEKVEELSLDGLLTALDESNIAFRSLYNHRSEWLEAQKMQGSMRDIRRPLDLAFRNVASAINSLHEVNELGEKNADTRQKLEVMIVGINAHIDNALRVIAYRSPGHSSKPDPEPEPGPGPVVEPFRFTAQRQSFSFSSNKMSIEAADHDAFRNGVDESMIGAIVNFQTDDRPNRFTISDIIYVPGELAEGLYLVPTDEQDLLGSFSGPQMTVEGIQDEQVVIIIDGVQAPDLLA